MIRKLATAGSLRVLGELSFQYLGYDFSDPVVERHFTLAEELDLPVAVHAGPGARASHSSSRPDTVRSWAARWRWRSRCCVTPRCGSMSCMRDGRCSTK